MKWNSCFLAISMLVLCQVVQGAPPPAKPVNKSAAPDLEFLEYLGTLESEDENWTDVVEMKRQKQAATPKSNSADAKAKASMSPSQRVESSHEQ